MRECLVAARFKAVDTSEEYAPVTFPNADVFREFASTVVCRPYLGQLGDENLYWRLNMAGKKPPKN